VTVRPVPHEERIADLVAAFERGYGRPPQGVAEAPGRVNLIGEHVDYNDGFVLPLAIDRSVLCAWRRRNDDRMTLQSLDMSGNVACWPAEIPTPHHAWFDYGVGVAAKLAEAGYRPWGLNLLTAGDVPLGAGLSSSAALELAVAGALRGAFELPIGEVELALLCQRAENEYVGVRCGIMDQFASTLSRRGHALLLDCRSLEYEHVPLRLEEAGLSIVIADSAVRRELASSAYNNRRHECDEAVAELRASLGRPSLSSLRDVTEGELRAVAIDSVPMRRARHVATEIGRVRQAADALSRDDFARFGKLMRVSHESLRDDYEVSSPQLDLLVELASAQPYVLGSRLTGAGFGGCTVSLVRTDAVDDFTHDVIEPYQRKTGLGAKVYVTSPCNGLRTWRL
jgi:galactokinase